MKSIYQNDNWLKLQEEQEHGEAIEYIYEDDNGKILYPFIKRKAGKINGIEYYDLVTARGERGIEVEPTSYAYDLLINNFNNDFDKYCKKNKIIAEFVRFSPWRKDSEKFNKIYSIREYGNLYCVNLEEDFFNTQFTASLRRDVKRAIRNQIEIELDFEGKKVEDFLKLYNFTEKKYNVSDYYKLNGLFIKDYFIKLKGKAFFINAYYENNLISSCLILLGKDIAHYHFSANNPNYKNIQANSYLLYESMIYAKKQGKSLFDLGGATPNSNLEFYKMKFINKREDCIYPYYVGTKIRNQKIYDELVKKVGGPRNGYFPEYRR